MNNALLFFGGLLVVVLAALFAVPTFVDWNGYRGVFEEEASKVLGRDVRVGGSVNLRLLPAPYVRFEKVRLADVTGQTGEPFVRAESFTMWLSGPALLRGVLEASRIDLDKPELTLALDGQGGGNWTSIELRPGDLPFVPRDVTLKSVNINDGTLALYNAEAQRIAFVDAISGELSADGIKGPFHFKGGASWSGSAHDVKFATTTSAGDGSFRFKSVVKILATPNSYVIDGAIEDFTGKPRFKGTLAGKVAVPGVEAAALDSGAKEPPVVPVMDVKADLSADAGGAEFSAINLSLDEAVEPQIITGSAKAKWGGVPELNISLGSKWLDLDRLSGAGEDSAKFARVRRMGLGLMKAVVGDGAAHAQIDIEQVKVGGETAGGLKIDAERTGNVLKIRELKAGLPGGSRLDVMGDVTDSAGAPAFAGRLFIRGTSLARLKAWAGKSGATIDLKADGAFSAEGRLAFNDVLFELADANGEIDGEPISGAIKVSSGDRLMVDVMLESAKIDTREFFPDTARAIEASLRRALGFAAANDEESNTPLTGGMKLRLLAAELVGASESFRDVDVTMRFDDGAISIENAHVTTSAGVTLGLEGRVKTVDGVPRGALGFELIGTTPEALGDLARLFDVEALLDGPRLALLREAKIAGLIKVGARGGKAFDVTFDGVARGARVTGSAEFDDGLPGWRTGQSRLQVTLEAPALRVLAAFAGIRAEAPGTVAMRPARAVVAAAGAIGDNLSVRADVRSDGFEGGFDGRASWPEGKPVIAQGTMSLKVGEAADVLAMIGVSTSAGLAGTSAAGTIEVVRDDTGWTLATRRLALGLSHVDGSLRIDAASAKADAVAGIKGDLAVDHVNVTALLSGLTDSAPATEAPAEATESRAAEATARDTGASEAGTERALWPGGLFNFGLLDGVAGDLRLSFAALEVSGNLATGPGTMTLVLTPSTIRVDDLKAAAAGGNLAGRIALEKAQDGVALTAGLQLADVDMSRLGASARGKGALDVTTNARAQSPAGLIAVMSGSGTVTIADAEVPAPDSTIVADIADSAASSKLANEPERLEEAVRMALAGAKVSLGSRSIDFTIADGSARLKEITLETERGPTSAATTVDLMTLDLTSSWFLTSNMSPLPPPTIPLPGWTPPPSKGPLPPVVVAYTGRLDDLKSLSPTISVAEFQRELVVRQMERSVQELELLRRTDEQRARLDKERRKALEQERAAAKAQRLNEQKAKEGEQPPPGPTGPEGSPPPNGGDAALPSPQQDGAPPPGAASGDNGAAAPAATTEPTPPTGGQQDAAGAVEPLQIDPETGLPIVPNPNAQPKPPAPRPASAQRAQRQPRTTADEVMRSLGGFP